MPCNGVGELVPWVARVALDVGEADAPLAPLGFHKSRRPGRKVGVDRRREVALGSPDRPLGVAHDLNVGTCGHTGEAAECEENGSELGAVVGGSVGQRHGASSGSDGHGCPAELD
eukprot:8640072-Alexandrium_andersonii.AAC.1